MSERIPHVAVSIEWTHPSEAKVIIHSMNTDRAASRLTDVVRSAIQHALETDDGIATVTITVVRKAEKPRSALIACA